MIEKEQKMRIVNDVTFDANGKRYVTIFGTSSESKPTQGFCMGSCFIEVDTGKAYLFNETTSAWVEQ
jgi:ABC-type proline/glycine betaine transport system ATPase subunit